MKKMFKVLAGFLAIFMLLSAFSGCGKVSSDTAGKSTTDSGSQAASDDTAAAEPKKDVTVKMFVGATGTKEAAWATIAENVEKDLGIKFELVPVAGDNGDEVNKKMSMALLSGDTTDTWALGNPNDYALWTRGDFIQPLNDIAKEINLDLEATYGRYLKKEADGRIFGVPYNVSKWMVFYNKKIFDDAGVPYPDSGKAWTWSEYIETAKKLTKGSGKDKIYGSLMLDYDCYKYMTATQKGVAGYKADGTFNYDDPAFKDALKLFYDLGNTYKVQPSYLEFKMQKIAWDAFMNGKYGMHVIADWYLALLTDAKGHPHDWKAGIAPLPHPDGAEKWYNFGVGASYAINKSSEHPKEALQVLDYIARNKYKYSNVAPANELWSEADKKAFYEGASKQLNGEITVDDLVNVFTRTDEGYTDEKIVGPGSSEINKMIDKESELYLFDKRSLDDTVKVILDQGNKIIADEKAKEKK